MTLLQFINALSTQNVSVVVIDGDTDATLIEFKSQGIAGVEGDVSARNVKRWRMNGATAVEVVLDTAQP